MVAVSPMLSYFGELLKEPGAVPRYMPVWRWAELAAARERLYPHVSKELAMDQYYVWGGVPRYVLEKAAPENKTEILLKIALSRTAAAALLSAADSPLAADDFSGTLIHIGAVVGAGAPPRYDFSKGSMFVASPHIEMLLLNKFGKAVMGRLEGSSGRRELEAWAAVR